MLVQTIELSFGGRLQITCGCLHQRSLDQYGVSSYMIVAFCRCEGIDLELELIPTNYYSFGSLRLMAMQNTRWSVLARSLFFCQIRKWFFKK